VEALMMQCAGESLPKNNIIYKAQFNKVFGRSLLFGAMENIFKRMTETGKRDQDSVGPLKVLQF